MNPESLGAASLAACIPPLLGALGWRGSKAALAEILPPEQKAWDLADLLPRLKKLGFGTVRKRLTSWELERPSLPALVLSREGTWFCLVDSADNGYHAFQGSDQTWPVLTAAQLKSDFDRSLYLAFDEAPPDPASKVSPFWVQDFASQHRDMLGAALAYTLILSFFGILSPQFMGLLYQEITTMTSPVGLVSLGLGALLFAGGEVVFLTLRQFLLNNIQQQITEALDTQVVRRILSFPLVMGMNISTAVQFARIKEFESLAEIFGRPVIRSLLDLPFMTILLVALGFMGRTMVLVPLVAIAVFFVLAVFAYPVLKKLEKEASADSSEVQTRLNAVLDHGSSIQVLGLDDHWKKNIEKAELDALPSQLNRGQLSATYGFVSSALVSLTGIVAVLVGVGEVMAGTIPSGALMASMMLIWRILDPFRSLFVLLGSLQSAVQSGQRLQKFMAIAGEPKPDPSRPPLVLPSSAVRVEGLYFKYPQASRFALANVSFSVPAQGSLHIGGNPGSGKSSLALSLLGLVEGSAGRILVGEQNLRQYHPAAYRKAVGYLPAHVPILPVSVKENLRLARADASDEQLRRALADAGLLEDVEGLTQGWDTILDERFSSRTDFLRSIGIARLLLRETSLWILDEPANGLEAPTRKQFLRALEDRKGKVTLVLLTNDADFAALADQHGRLDQGRYQQEGS